jgi:hypothetical protein
MASPLLAQKPRLRYVIKLEKRRGNAYTRYNQSSCNAALQRIIFNIQDFLYMTKRALITGITGQDGSFLTELLLEKATTYTVLFAALHPSIRSASTIFTKTRMNRARGCV